MKIFPLSFCCIIICIILLQQGCNNPIPGLLQPCTMVVTVSITRLNTRLLQPCFMVVTTLNYNLVTTLLHPCNKVVISVWEVLICMPSVSVRSCSAFVWKFRSNHQKVKCGCGKGGHKKGSNGVAYDNNSCCDKF